MRVSLILLVAGAFLAFLVYVIIRQIAEGDRQKRLSQVTGIQEKSDKKEIIQSVSVTKKLKSSGGDEGLKKGGLRDLIQQAGYTTSLQKFWIYSAITSFVTFLIFLVWGVSKPALILFTLTGFLGLPKFYLKFKGKRRQKRFLAEFADALDAMVRLLKAGMPVTEAIAMASREFEGPVAVEMAYIYDQQRVGVSLANAAERSALRMPITEMQMFATAVAIQSETGASLSEVLTNLSGVIRARFKLKRKVVALSSEARTSAMIIGALPIMVASVLNLVNPEYMSLLFEDRTGNVLLWCCGIWMTFGILVMRAMINFRV